VEKNLGRIKGAEVSESPFMPAHSVQGPNECEHSFHSFHSVKLQSTGAFGLTSGKSA
jgi:hypothetical protein